MDPDCGCFARGIWHEIGQSCDKAIWAMTGRPLFSEDSKMKIRRNDTEEARRYWKTVDDAAKTVASWPSWKQGNNGQESIDDNNTIDQKVEKMNNGYTCEVCGNPAYLFTHSVKGGYHQYCSIKCKYGISKQVKHNRPEGEEDE